MLAFDPKSQSSVPMQLQRDYVLLLITFTLSKDDDVCPSVTGLTNLYSWLVTYDKRSENNTLSPFPTKRLSVVGENLVFHVLTGIPVSGRLKDVASAEEFGKLASVGEGLCIYRLALSPFRRKDDGRYPSRQ